MNSRASTQTSNVRRIASDITDWFLANARDLPWRRTLDPYSIWVSEIMLQQTQVRTVIPFWERWMRRLPTVDRLADAEEATLLKLWEGLGYYSRVRNLQRAARQIVAEHAGVFPTEPEAIRSLPGVGRYTTGAIASIAFDHPEAILDGNVIRVLCRLFAVSGNPKDKAVNERLWILASELVRTTAPKTAIRRDDGMLFAGRRSALNQGMMELGATMCLPANPDCGRCPVRGRCEAFRREQTQAFPEVAKRATVTTRDFHTFILQRGGKYLVRQRGEGEVNAGFWEFPGIELAASGETPESSFRRLFDGPGVELVAVTRLQHSITRYRYRQHVFRGEWPPRRRPGLAGGEWVSLDEICRRPFYSPQLRLLKALQ